MPFRPPTFSVVALLVFWLISGFSVSASEARGFSAGADALVGALARRAARENAEISARSAPASDAEQECIFAAVRDYLRLPPAPGEARPGVIAAESPSDFSGLGPVARYRPEVGDILIVEPDAAPAELAVALAGEYARYLDLARLPVPAPDELAADVQGVRDRFRDDYPSALSSCGPIGVKARHHARGLKSEWAPRGAAAVVPDRPRAPRREAPLAPAAASAGAATAKAPAAGRALTPARAVLAASRPAPGAPSPSAAPARRKAPPPAGARRSSPRKAVRARPSGDHARTAKADPSAPSDSAPARGAPAGGARAQARGRGRDSPIEAGAVIAQISPPKRPSPPEIPLPRPPDYTPFPARAAKRKDAVEREAMRAPLPRRPAPTSRRDDIVLARTLPPRRLPLRLREPLNPGAKPLGFDPGRAADPSPPLLAEGAPPRAESRDQRRGRRRDAARGRPFARARQAGKVFGRAARARRREIGGAAARVKLSRPRRDVGDRARRGARALRRQTHSPRERRGRAAAVHGPLSTRNRNVRS